MTFPEPTAVTVDLVLDHHKLKRPFHTQVTVLCHFVYLRGLTFPLLFLSKLEDALDKTKHSRDFCSFRGRGGQGGQRQRGGQGGNWGRQGGWGQRGRGGYGHHGHGGQQYHQGGGGGGGQRGGRQNQNATANAVNLLVGLSNML